MVGAAVGPRRGAWTRVAIGRAGPVARTSTSYSSCAHPVGLGVPRDRGHRGSTGLIGSMTRTLVLWKFPWPGDVPAREGFGCEAADLASCGCGRTDRFIVDWLGRSRVGCSSTLPRPYPPGDQNRSRSVFAGLAGRGRALLPLELCGPDFGGMLRVDLRPRSSSALEGRRAGSCQSLVLGALGPFGGLGLRKRRSPSVRPKEITAHRPRIPVAEGSIHQRFRSRTRAGLAV
jgi:hypothetical protein